MQFVFARGVKFLVIRICSALLFLAAIPCLVASEKTIVSIQPNTQTTLLDTKIDEKFGFVRLINLNTDFNSWYLLEVTWPGETAGTSFHLENVQPGKFKITVDKSFMDGLIIMDGITAHRCPLWNSADSELRKAKGIAKTFVPICGGRVYVRNETEGTETTQEFVADLLRKHVWGGEKITGLVKDYLYKDKFLITSKTSEMHGETPPPTPEFKNNPHPKNATIAKEHENVAIEAKDLGIVLADADPKSLGVGRWYPTKASKHAFVSVIQPKFIDKSIFTTYPKRVRPLDSVENSALIYLIAFHLRQYDIGFSMGTMHPSLEWSDRAPDKLRESKEPGPDGISHSSWLVRLLRVKHLRYLQLLPVALSAPTVRSNGGGSVKSIMAVTMGFASMA
jgi:hypothetical protein